MSRPISTAAKEAIFGQSTDQVFIILLKISHSDLAEDICVCRNSENITSNGIEYQAYPFEMALPDDQDAPSEVSVLIDNVDRSITDSIRAITSPADVTISVVLASSPDTVEVGPYVMQLRTATYDAMTVQGTLMYEDVLNQGWPGDRFIPSNFPGLF